MDQKQILTKSKIACSYFQVFLDAAPCLIGSLRSTTPTSTKTSPQNITLHYRKFLAVWPSRSRLTMWPKYPKNKLVRAVSDQK